MSKRPRLTGIDLFRGIAIFAVIILHSDIAAPLRSPSWQAVRQFALFAVPFFLATSFYLAIGKLYSSSSPYSLKPRLTRLLIPYAVWSVLYLLYKAAKYVVDGDTEQLTGLLDNPVGLIFFGDAAFHLYFLPLLMTGMALIKVIEPLIRSQARPWLIAGLGTVSLLAYEGLLRSGNAFDIDSGTAFQPLLEAIAPGSSSNPLLRIAAVGLAWSLRCLPYLFIAALLSHPLLQNSTQAIGRQTVLLLAVFLIVNAFGHLLLPEAIHELLRGYVTLLLAIACSARLPESGAIASLGACSFGMYLIHLMIVEAFLIVGNKLGLLEQISAPILLVVCILTFGLAWAVTALLGRQKPLSSVLYGAS